MPHATTSVGEAAVSSSVHAVWTSSARRGGRIECNQPCFDNSHLSVLTSRRPMYPVLDARGDARKRVLVLRHRYVSGAVDRGTCQ